MSEDTKKPEDRVLELELAEGQEPLEAELVEQEGIVRVDGVEVGREGTDVALLRIVDKAVTQDLNPEVLERLLAVHERVQANEARRLYNEAVAALRADLPPIVKTEEVDYKAKGGRVQYRHENLAHMVEDLSPVMARHGLSFRWKTEQPEPKLIRVVCIVSHAAGHSEETELFGPPDETGNKNRIQQIASTVTYLQRYTLKAALGLAAGKDTDGNGSGPPAEEAPIAAPRAQGQEGDQANGPGDVDELEQLEDALELFPQGDDLEAISGNQLGRLRNVAQKAGWTNEGLDAELGIVLKISASEIPALGPAYEAIVRWFDTHGPDRS